MILHTPQGRALLETEQSLNELFSYKATITTTEKVTAMQARQILAGCIAPVVRGHGGALVPHQHVEIVYTVALAQSPVGG